MADLYAMEITVLRDHILRYCHLAAILRAVKGWYWLSGLQVIQRGAGANMSVDVNAGTCTLAGVLKSIASANVAIDASDATNPRIDLLYVAATGTLTILKGTAKVVKPATETTWQKYEEPYPADISTTPGLILAEILVRANTTSILNADIRMLGVPVL
jgi:hypothetical protein